MRGTAWFQDLGVADAVLAGGKGANLGELGASRWHLPGAPGRNCVRPRIATRQADRARPADA